MAEAPPFTSHQSPSFMYRLGLVLWEKMFTKETANFFGKRFRCYMKCEKYLPEKRNDTMKKEKGEGWGVKARSTIPRIEK